jgi:hypothetical protein
MMPTLQRGASTLETKELYSDSQQQAVNMKILESRKRMKGQMALAGPSERDCSPTTGPTIATHLELARPQLDLAGRQLELGAAQRQLELAARPPLFGLPGQKYF